MSEVIGRYRLCSKRLKVSQVCNCPLFDEQAERRLASIERHEKHVWLSSNFIMPPRKIKSRS